MTWILIIATSATIFQPLSFPSQESCTRMAVHLIEISKGTEIDKPDTVFACFQVGIKFSYNHKFKEKFEREKGEKNK